MLSSSSSIVGMEADLPYSLASSSPFPPSPTLSYLKFLKLCVDRLDPLGVWNCLLDCCCVDSSDTSDSFFWCSCNPWCFESWIIFFCCMMSCCASLSGYLWLLLSLFEALVYADSFVSSMVSKSWVTDLWWTFSCSSDPSARELALLLKPELLTLSSCMVIFGLFDLRPIEYTRIGYMLSSSFFGASSIPSKSWRHFISYYGNKSTS